MTEINSMIEMFTPSECDVMERLTLGHTDFEIAEALGISTNTVKFHLKNAFRKLECTNRTRAAVLFDRRNRQCKDFLEVIEFDDPTRKFERIADPEIEQAILGAFKQAASI